jgi:DHA2 family multidrug resistance protein
MIQAGVKQQIMASIGMFMFFIFCMWGYKILTPDTGKEAFFWMLIMRGIAMALLFIPVTTLSLSTLKGREIGEGAAFTGMMRQLGGSFGIAMITTFMAQQTMVHRADLVSKLDVTSLTVQSRVTGMQQAMIAKGEAPNIALQKAYQFIDYGVMKQASVLSYMDVFKYIGIMFLICVPFVLMVKGNKKKKGEKLDLSAAH